MANVTPTTPVRAFPSSSLKVPANFTKRGTGNGGTTSRGAWTVPLGACGSAATGCCACTAGITKPNVNRKAIPTYLAIRFMGLPLSSGAEEIRILFRGRPQRTSTEGGTNQGKLGDDPENCANTTLAFVKCQRKMLQCLIDKRVCYRKFLSCFEYTYTDYFQNCSPHYCILQTDADRQRKS